jgi:hypothetical protein
MDHAHTQRELLGGKNREYFSTTINVNDEIMLPIHISLIDLFKGVCSMIMIHIISSSSFCSELFLFKTKLEHLNKR